jgi:hypothetical protein
MKVNVEYNHKAADAASDISDELFSAKEKYPENFNSLHEGYAVLKEEVDELWDEIKKKNPNKANIYTEAKQVAAMAIRIMVELQ